MLRLFKNLYAYVKPDATLGQIIVLYINLAQKLRSTLGNQKKNIKYNNNSGLPVKMQLLKAIRIAWDFFELSL